MLLNTSPPSPSSSSGDAQMTATSMRQDGSYGPSRAILPVWESNDGNFAAASQVGSSSRTLNNLVTVSPEILSQMFNPRSLAAFHALGGLPGLATALRSDVSSGLSRDETVLEGIAGGSGSSSVPNQRTQEPYVNRKAIFGENRLPERTTKNILQLMWIALNDRVLILLSTAATVSLALGLYQTFGQPHRPGQPRVEWVEGVAIMTAVIIVLVAGALNDYQKEQQFARLNKRKEDRSVKAIRSGRSVEISIYNILVGDVLHLEPGDMIPVDGILISGHNVRCDESSTTGESHRKKKTSGNAPIPQTGAGLTVDKFDPFIISGSKVSEGIGTYLVTCVGVHSTYGRLKMALAEDTEATPLQRKLGIVANQIATAAVAVATCLFIILLVRFLIQLPTSHDSPFEKGQTCLRILIASISLAVVAVPEGLPLAVTLALAIAATRMLKDNNLVRILAACETMGNATTVCSDKTGTITTNKMTVTIGTLGTVHQFGDWRELQDQRQPNGPETPGPRKTTVTEFASLLSPEVRKILVQSIAINSTAFEDNKDDTTTIVGSKTEAALLSFAKERLEMGELHKERTSVTVVEVIPFDSSRKYMASVIQLSSHSYRMFVKGAADILLKKSTWILSDATQSINGVPLARDKRQLVAGTIDEYAAHSLRTIALAYRDFQLWPPPGISFIEEDLDEVAFNDVLGEMTFLGVVGIRDPLRPGVTDAVAKCQHAGVRVMMVTGDNVGTAKAIATECGIHTKDGLVMEGPTFRKLPTPEIYQVIPQIQVLAQSSPEDKRILVERLKELGETVAVTGDGTNDGPALRTADIGFSMGLCGTEVAKEASAIILMDDNFASIVKAIEWGRTVNDAIAKFVQFQLTVNITAVTLTIVSAIASDDGESILNPVQLLWVNLIMDTFAALALATDPPNPAILDRQPDRKSAPLIALDMWKMIIGQAMYQLIITVTLNFAGNMILCYKTQPERATLKTLVFNTYVFMQLFNQYNSRRLDQNLNIFEGLSQNWYFIGINLITVAGQVFIIFFGGSALSTTRLSALQWCISVCLGAISLPVGVIIRLIPNRVFIQQNPPIRLDDDLPDNGRNARSAGNTALHSVRREFVSLKERTRSVGHCLKYYVQHSVELVLSVFSKRTTTPRSLLEDGEGPSDDEQRPLLRANDLRGVTRKQVDFHN